MTIARQRLVKHVPERYAVNNRRPLLYNGFREHEFPWQRFAKHFGYCEIDMCSRDNGYADYNRRMQVMLAWAFCIRLTWGYKRRAVCQTNPASRIGRRKGKSRIWDSKIWPRVPRESDPKRTALAKERSNSKRQTRPLVREGAPHQQTRSCLTVIKIWSYAPDGCFIPRQTGRLTVGRNIRLRLRRIRKWVSRRN
jgi:hypothetical protein